MVLPTPDASEPAIRNGGMLSEQDDLKVARYERVVVKAEIRCTCDETDHNFYACRLPLPDGEPK